MNLDAKLIENLPHPRLTISSSIMVVAPRLFSMRATSSPLRNGRSATTSVSSPRPGHRRSSACGAPRPVHHGRPCRSRSRRRPARRWAGRSAAATRRDRHADGAHRGLGMADEFGRLGQARRLAADGAGAFHHIEGAADARRSLRSGVTMSSAMRMVSMAMSSAAAVPRRCRSSCCRRRSCHRDR